MNTTAITSIPKPKQRRHRKGLTMEQLKKDVQEGVIHFCRTHLLDPERFLQYETVNQFLTRMRNEKTRRLPGLQEDDHTGGQND